MVIVGYRRTARHRHVALSVSRSKALKGNKTWVVYARTWLQALRWIVMGLLIVALARPQQRWYEEKIDAEAIDIMLAMDISPSMLSRDFNPDRLAVAKQLSTDFVQQRKYDAMGLVAFSGGAFTHCPLTNDHNILRAFINNLQVGRLPDGTAIGMGLIAAVNRLKDSPAKSKVVILMTDGEDNTGQVGPMKAAEIARSLGIKVYTVGLGNDGKVMSPSAKSILGTYIYTARNMVLDTQLLEAIAARTGGKFYRARSSNDLKGIYAEIDQLEKTKLTISKTSQTLELFFWVLNAAFCLLLLEMVLRWGPLRIITG
jgi:Ca-activated chloride channel family protein